MTKRIALLFAVAMLAILLVPTLAFANFGPHGSYVSDTDACAGCHRAHTSVSSITWTDQANNDHSALLVSSATTLYEFCYACHDATSQGADTNVQEGIYEGTLYGDTGGTLNGGGFESFGGTATVTSTHMFTGASWGAYGGGYTGMGLAGADGEYTSLTDPPDAQTGESVQIQMDCGTCHDPHGSSNYRVLKAYANGNYVGGYTDSGDPENPNPDPFVWSNETGYPAAGFKLHTEYPNYIPNYTSPLYAKGYDVNAQTGALNQAKGMSGWCVGCHSSYMTWGTTASSLGGGGVREYTKSDGTTYTSEAWTYNAGDGGQLALRHKHPINVELSTYNAADKASMIITAQVLPLANNFPAAAVGNGTNAADSTDWIECLTCHRAHGTSAIMTGFATADGSRSIVGTDGLPHNVFVASDSALLRLDNRGVCQVCHNK